MKKNLKLGILTVTSLAMLTAAIFLIGTNKGFFMKSVTVHCQFRDVDGLRKGNFVLYSGVRIGVVKEVFVKNDTTIMVTAQIYKDKGSWIREDAIATIGSDGLVGNKILDIRPGEGKAGYIHEGSYLLTENPVNTGNVLRTLAKTNESIAVLAGDLVDVMHQIRNENGIVAQLLNDTVIYKNLKLTTEDIRKLSWKTLVLMGDLEQLTAQVKQGQGTVGMLLVDTLQRDQVRQTLVQFKSLSDSLGVIVGDLSGLSGDIRSDQGVLGVLVSDTVATDQIRLSLYHVQQGTENFDKLTEALKYNFLFRRGLKKMEKEKEKVENNE
jgi:phospholipid/cholesterol/gamma-HCH transport system substrate-binding protein